MTDAREAPATPRTPTEPASEAVVFDLGGALAEFRGAEAMRQLAGIDDDDEVWRR